MTTIAYRDGVMAADTVANFDGLKKNSQKIHRINDALIGHAGNTLDALVFKRWWGAGVDFDALPEFRQYGSNDGPDFCALVAEPGRLSWWEQHFQPIEITDEFWAIGSGEGAAMAAMHMGADAAEAVRIAALVDYQTNGAVHVERLGDALACRAAGPG